MSFIHCQKQAIVPIESEIRPIIPFPKAAPKVTISTHLPMFELTESAGSLER